MVISGTDSQFKEEDYGEKKENKYFSSPNNFCKKYSEREFKEKPFLMR